MINHRSFFENNQANYQAESLAGFAHSGITDFIIMDAIDKFIVSCKKRGNWTSIIGLYLLAGSTAGTQATNWRNPAQYNLTGLTGVTHSSAGMQANGTTNLVDTGITVSTSGLTPSDCHLAMYTSTTAMSGTAVADMGAFNGSHFLELGVYGTTPRPKAATLTQSVSNGGSYSETEGVYYVEAASAGLMLFHKRGYTTGSSISGSGAATVGNITGTLKLTATTNNAGTVSKRANKTYGFFSVGGKANNVTGYLDDIYALMQAFNR